MALIEVDTPHGPARVHLRVAAQPKGALILGHGAGGGIAARDLQAAGEVALDRGLSTAFVEQPYRVAGRRAPAPGPRLDAAWNAVIAQLAGDQLSGLPLILGGRSLGARVACRTADAHGAVGVLCLAFPLLPPRRARSPRPPESRIAELEAVSAPTLVVQGKRDPFGLPSPGPRRRVVVVSGDHSLRSDLPGVAQAVGDWLDTVPAWTPVA
ncbi:MAG: alpha/beta hydrolase [Actinomycetota bacterium]|nr:alpha/beta hydrolase [Actinomycetota bacterium]